MPRSTREGWIDWKNSAAKEILMDDLHCGLLPADAADLSALEAWDICYKHMVEFVAVDYDQFKDRLRDHQRQVPYGKTSFGPLVSRILWRMTDAYFLDKRKIIVANLYSISRMQNYYYVLTSKKESTTTYRYMTPTQLQRSRVAYHPFNTRKFKHRIYQEVRRVKFIKYLEQKRGGTES